MPRPRSSSEGTPSPRNFEEWENRVFEYTIRDLRPDQLEYFESYIQHNKPGIWERYSAYKRARETGGMAPYVKKSPDELQEYRDRFDESTRKREEELSRADEATPGETATSGATAGGGDDPLSDWQDISDWASDPEGFFERRYPPERGTGGAGTPR